MSRRIPTKASQYWTPKHDYLTAIHWCLRYPDWKKEILSLPDSNKGIAYDKDKVQSSNDFDSTAEMAIRRVEIQSKINLLESTAKLCMPERTEFLIKGVTEEGITYQALRNMGMPYSRNLYFLMRQKFYHLISRKI